MTQITLLKQLTLNFYEHLISHASKEEMNLIPATIEFLNEREQKKLETKLHLHVSPLKIPFLIAWMMDSLTKEDSNEFYSSLPAPFKVLYKLFWKNSFLKKQKIVI